jgi:DNA-binding response OmpR family regulator
MEIMNRYTILIADDDDRFRNSLAVALQPEGYNLIFAKDGLEAILKVTNNTVDIAVLDIKMPNVNGIEALIQIKKINPNIPVIMIGSESYERLKKLVLKLSAYAYFEKPFNLKKLLNTIKEVLKNE